MMKNILITAMFCISLVCGCEKTEKTPPPVPSAFDSVKKSDESQGPYYAGLIEEFRATLADDPDNLAAIVGLGNAYFDSGQWNKAVTLYEHALLLDPQNADVRTDMGTSYRNAGMPDRALAEYRIALQVEPGHLSARYNMGIVLAHDKRDYRAAIRVWEELLKLAPNYPHADDIRSGIAAFSKILKKEGR
jgi:tetratricopeptide (TPR) repeat protein